MTLTSPPSLAEAAYNAYCATRNWKSFDGKPLPQWPEVKPEIQAGWVAASNAVAALVVGQPVTRAEG
jgi:hypothetical protein